MLRQARHLERYELRARDGKNLGHVRDFYFDDGAWAVRYLAVETGAWFDGRRILVSPASVSRVDWNGNTIAVDLTQAQVRHSPQTDAREIVSRDDEAALSRYYHWPAYWGAPGSAEVGLGLPLVPIDVPAPAEMNAELAHPAPAGNAAPATVRTDAPRLRSVCAITGNPVEAADGPAGHVGDFLIDDRSWAIRYLLVATRHGWHGRHVIVAPQWIDDLGHAEARVHVALTREAIRNSPPFDPEAPLTPDHAGQLHDRCASAAGRADR